MPRQVLLLGSDKFLTDLLYNVFDISEFEVYKCSNIATAAELIKKSNFDCFITDQNPDSFDEVNITGLLAMTCRKDRSTVIDFYCKLL